MHVAIRESEGKAMLVLGFSPSDQIRFGESFVRTKILFLSQINLSKICSAILGIITVGFLPASISSERVEALLVFVNEIERAFLPETITPFLLDPKIPIFISLDRSTVELWRKVEMPLEDFLDSALRRLPVYC